MGSFTTHLLLLRKVVQLMLPKFSVGKVIHLLLQKVESKRTATSKEYLHFGDSLACRREKNHKVSGFALPLFSPKQLQRNTGKAFQCQMSPRRSIFFKVVPRTALRNFEYAVNQNEVNHWIFLCFY